MMMQRIIIGLATVASASALSSSMDNDCVTNKFCPAVYDPVCGVDNNTYGNACEAGCVEILHEGECVPKVDDCVPSEICLAVYEPVCGVDNITYSNECQAGCVEILHEGECAPKVDDCVPSEVCPAIYEPVCGVDKITYSNKCQAGCVEILHEGPCVKQPPVCCRALTAKCLSCVNGVSVREYCEENPLTVGCPNPPKCCKVNNAKCLSCNAGISEEQYCKLNPRTPGCKKITCFFHGEEYAVGEQYRDDCNTCTCGENGVAVCTEKACKPCSHEYTLCNGYYGNLGCIYAFNNIFARCVEKEECKPKECALDSTCTPFLCTEETVCKKKQLIGSCQILSEWSPIF